MIKSPEYLLTNNEMFNYVVDYWKLFENAYRAEDGYADYQGNRIHYRELADIDSMVEYWLVMEIMGNDDAIWKSRYAYKDINGKIIFGPVWDFDYGCGSSVVSSSGRGWRVLTWGSGFGFYVEFIDDPFFIVKTTEKYWEIRSWLEELIKENGILDKEIEYLSESGHADTNKWPTNVHWARTRGFDVDASTFAQYMTERVAWLDEQFASDKKLLESTYTEQSASPFIKADDKISFIIPNAKEDFVSKNAPAEYMITEGKDVILGVNVTDSKTETVCLYINGIYYDNLVVYDGYAEILLPSSALNEALGKKNVISVIGKNNEGTTTYRNFTTIIKVIETNSAVPVARAIVSNKLNLEYNGNSQKMVTVSEEVGGTVYYALGNEGGPTEKFSTTIPEKCEIGDYYIWYKVIGDADHKDSMVGSVKISIGKANPLLVSPLAKENESYNETAISLLEPGVVSGGAIRFALENGFGELPSEVDYKDYIPEAINAGTYKIWYKVTGSDKYYDIEPRCIVVNISPITVDSPQIVLSYSSFIYDGNEKKPDVKVYVNGKEIDSDEYSVSYLDNINVGTGYVIITDNEGGNYTVNGSCSFSISEAVPALFDISAVEGLVYNGTAQELLNVEGSVTGGTLQYAIGSDDTTVPGKYGDDIPKETNADNYYVWYKVVGDTNYTDIAPASIVVNISPVIVTNPEMVLLEDSYTYDESEKTPSVKVYVNGKEISEDEYSVSYKDNVDVGTATVVITDKTGGNYTINGSKEFTILAPEPAEESDSDNVGEGEGTQQVDDTGYNTGTSDGSGYSYGGSSGYTGYSGGSYTGGSTVGGSGSTNSNSKSDNDKNGTKTGSNSGEVKKPDKEKNGKEDSDKADGKDDVTSESGEDIVETSKKTYKSGKVVEKTKVTKADGTVENTKVTTSAKGTVTEDKTVTSPDGTIVKSHSTVKKNGSSTYSVLSYDKKGKATITAESVSSKGKKTSLGLKNTSKKTDKRGRKTAKVTDLDTTGTKAEIPSEVTVDGVTYKITTVGKSLLAKNSNVTQITLGDNIKTIEKNAFKNAKKLEKIYLGGNITKIGKNAFSGVDNVTVYIRTDSEDKFKDIKDAVIKAGIGEHVSFAR